LRYPFAQLVKGHGLFGPRPSSQPDGKPDPRSIDPRRLRRWRLIAWFTAMALLPVNALLVVVCAVIPLDAAPPSIPLLIGLNLLVALPVALRATALLPYHPTANLITALAAAAPLLSLIAMGSLVVRLAPPSPRDPGR
jgi:hypothetical protein